MSLRDCLMSAVEQKAITRQEADELLKRFDELQAEFAFDMPEAQAALAAKEGLSRELRLEATRQKRLVALTEGARRRILSDVSGYRTRKGEADIVEGAIGVLEHYGFHGYSSVEGRMKSIVGMAHAEMEEALATFKTSALTGRRREKPRLENVVRELKAEGTGDATAKRMAESFAKVAEALRQRFNAAGGEIPLLKNWGLPHSHDASVVIQTGREGWKKAIVQRLDRDKMVDPLTGKAPTERRLDQLLDGSYDSIVTDGVIRNAPSGIPAGRGALANQRQDHRFLVFKTADDWLAYHSQFGQGDPFEVMMTHIRGMARDIAAMEILGPNPGTTIEWLKQTVQAEQAKAITGKASLFNVKNPVLAYLKGNYGTYAIDALWDQVRGREVVNARMATGFGAVREVITSAVLGSASVLAVATDPFLGSMAKRLSGLPVRNYFSEILRTLGQNRNEAVRAGLILEDAMHVMRSEARYAGTFAGPVWSQWLAERNMRLSGLQPWTQKRKHIFGMDFQAAIADRIGESFDALPERLRRAMQGYGIDGTDWQIMQMAMLHEPKEGAVFLRPFEIAAIADGPALKGVMKPLGIDAQDQATREMMAKAGVRRTAEKYLEMIIQETERAVPSGTKRSKAIVTGILKPGTVAGELLQSALQFKSFALSFTAMQIEAIARETADFGAARGASYAGHLLIGLTLAGGVAMQLKAIANGKDPEDMDPNFWLRAAQTGGGFGLYGDFLLADVNRFGHSLPEQILGPTFGLASDIGGLTIGNIRAAALGKPTNIGRETTDFVRRYTPLASLWYTRAAWNRVVMDQLQYLVDPKAHAAMRERERKALRDYNQGHWWRPGKVLPDRAPKINS